MKTVKIMMAVGLALATVEGAPAQDDILQKAINTPSIAYSFYGANQSAKVIRDKSVTGGQAYRVEVQKGANAYDAGASFAITKPIAKGDHIMLAFWARAPKLADGTTTLSLPFAGVIGPAPTYATVIGSPVQLDKEWKIRNVRGVAPADYPAGQASMTLHLAAETATIDLGPVFILDFGPKG